MSIVVLINKNYSKEKVKKEIPKYIVKFKMQIKHIEK